MIIISSKIQTQEQKIASLEAFRQDSEQFIEDTARIDSDVADAINQRKDDFYEEYYYLKPECEKNGWEKFCDGVKAVGEWCRENWKSIAKIVLTVVTIVAIGIASVGDILISATGLPIEIKEVLFEALPNYVKVYNFEVEEFNTYHVGNSGILVHNTCIKP